MEAVPTAAPTFEHVGIACLAQRKAPVRFTFITKFQSASAVS